jgi:hypothetical protein
MSSVQRALKSAMHPAHIWPRTTAPEPIPCWQSLLTRKLSLNCCVTD